MRDFANWIGDMRVAFPTIHPLLWVVGLYLIFTWLYFIKERSEKGWMALMPFASGVLFLTPLAAHCGF